MESSRDLTAASSNNGAGDIIEETYPSADADLASIRNRIACKTGHILNNLTSSLWYSYALLYFQHVVGMSAVSAGIIFFISQTLMAGSSLVITLGHDKRLWKPFSPYGRRKAWHIIGSAGVLFSWPFIFIPCLFCEDHSSNVTLGAYYLLSVALFSISWPLAEDSYYSLMTEIREENGKDTEASRSIVRVCKVCLYILLWVLLQESTESKMNSNVSEQFTLFAIILLPVGFVFVFAFHLTVLEPRPRADEGKPDEEKNCGRSTADVTSPATMVNHELTGIAERPKLKWFEWLKEPSLHKVGCIVVFSNITFRIVQSYLPLYVLETLNLRKESVAFFPLIIVISRIATELTCRSFADRLTTKPRVVILCTTFAIFGTCMWFFIQSASRISPVYVPTIIFAGMSSVITMVTPTLQQSIAGNSKGAVTLVSLVFECTERILLGGIVLAVQICYPGNRDRSVGEYLRVSFPATFGSCILVPLLVATASMSSKDSNEGPLLTVTAATPREEIKPIRTSQRVENCVERPVCSETSTPPVDIEHNERRRNSVEIQDIEEVKRALDELHRLPATDL
ncbi:major facilitator superfamily domain-containing protein 12-like isoform X2 [Stylophora pistillata]|uniref:major facilitator superfamily domain-containing protein 12-like isoform X2 n=1 Tax=Stylophora pistillata TaxID=50429 RepID=UPI000C04025E|nr:major facilitator superfamily domain-containing protein 12-like isoform X2 [Stylophora pistillata]